MRRIILTFIAASAALAVVVACSGGDRAGASSPVPLFRDAALSAPAPEAQVPTTSLAPLIERLKPVVVGIATTTVTRHPAVGRRGPGAGRGGDPFERFFGIPGPGGPDAPDELRGHGLGSGFILNGEGYILTNNHVVQDATDIRVTLSDDRELAAKVIGRDPVTDVALIKLSSPPKDLPTAALGDSDALRQGDFVLALGQPFGLRLTATLGIVSAKHRANVNPGAAVYDDYIQTDAAINPGNSGGPLFNLRGEVVGINTAIVSPQVGQGIGFAVPIGLARSLLPQLQAKGKVVRGYLGVSVSELTPDLVQAFGLPSGQKGALVQGVVAKGPAAKAGVEPGDVVVKLNGKAIESSGGLTREVALVPPGEKVTVVLLRRGAEKTLAFAVAQRPAEEGAAAQGPAEDDQAGTEASKSPKLGVRLQALTPELAKELGVQGDQGVLVAEVVDGGPAERAGLQRGDLILEVNRQAVSKPGEVASQLGKLKDGQMVLLRVRRGDAALFVAVPVGGRQ